MKRLLFVLAFVLGCVGAFAQPFPGQAADNPITFVASQSGFGQCASLIPTHWVSFATNPTGFTQTTGGTIDAWVNTTDNGLDIACSNNSTYGWWFGISSGLPTFTYDSLTIVIAGTVPINDGNWHLISLNIAAGASGTATIYVDGSSVASGSMTATYTMQVNNIGGYGSGYGATMEVDDIRLTGAPLYNGNFAKPSSPFANSAPNQIALYHFDGNLLDSNTAYTALVGGAVTRVSVTTTSQVIAQAAATGGTSPYSYQLQRSPHGAATWTNVGAASAYTSGAPPNVTDSGLAMNTIFDYQSQVTDSAGSPATADGALSSFATKDPLGLYEGFIGDSITIGAYLQTGQDPASVEQRILGNWNGTRTTVFVNEGVSGSTTTTWVATGSTFLNALAVFESNGVTNVSIMLGTNDSNSSNNISAATFNTNLLGITAALNAAGITATLNQAPYPNDGRSSGANLLLQSYFPYEVAMCNGSTIIQGDQTAYAVFLANANAYAINTTGSYYGTNVPHPNEFGAEVLATLWAYPLGRLWGVVGNGTRIISYAPNEDSLVYLFKEIASAA